MPGVSNEVSRLYPYLLLGPGTLNIYIMQSSKSLAFSSYRRPMNRLLASHLYFCPFIYFQSLSSASASCPWLRPLLLLVRPPLPKPHHRALPPGLLGRENNRMAPDNLVQVAAYISCLGFICRHHPRLHRPHRLHKTPRQPDVAATVTLLLHEARLGNHMLHHLFVRKRVDGDPSGVVRDLALGAVDPAATITLSLGGVGEVEDGRFGPAGGVSVRSRCKLLVPRDGDGLVIHDVVVAFIDAAAVPAAVSDALARSSIVIVGQSLHQRRLRGLPARSRDQILDLRDDDLERPARVAVAAQPAVAVDLRGREDAAGVAQRARGAVCRRAGLARFPRPPEMRQGAGAADRGGEVRRGVGICRVGGGAEEPHDEVNVVAGLCEQGSHPLRGGVAPVAAHV